jgi:hypothetical protein
MTFIEMLQQGGYALPQYSSAQQTYQVPGTGMQTLQTMMQIDQGANQRYVQGEQLNMQKAQTTQSIINSTIQNELNRKTQERLQKQMDLSNQKLEFDMQKEILSGMKALREETKTMFLDSDEAKIQQSLVDAGLDEAGMLKNMEMKGGLNFNNWMKEQVNNRKFLNMQKSALDRKYKFDQGEKFINDAEKQLARADALYKAGALDFNAYTTFQKNLNDSTKKLIGYNNGEVTDLNYSDDTWSGIIAAPDFLDEVQAKYNLDIENKLKQAKNIRDLSDAELNTAKAQQAAATTPFMIEKMKMETEQMRQQLPAELAILQAKGMIDGAKANILKGKIDAFYRDYPNPTLEDFSKLEGIINKEGAKQFNTFDAALIDSINRGDTARTEELLDAAQRLKQAEYIDKSTNSTVTYKSDSAGRQGAVDKSGNVNYGGYWTTNKDGADEWAGGIYGKKRIEAKFIKDKIEKNIIQPQADGSIKLNMTDSKVLEFFGISPTSNFGFGNWDSDDIKAAIPGATKSGDYWIIPPDNIAPPAVSTNNNSTFFQSGAPSNTSVSPDNPFLK